MNESQIDKAEQLLGYFEQHGADPGCFPMAAASEWWMGETVNLLRDMLPEWSAYREEVA